LFPLASFNCTVSVLVAAPLAVIDVGLRLTVDVAALAASAVRVTVVVLVKFVPSSFGVIVSTPAVVPAV
jgi:hypothetical protein